jgi:GT2 family glycosyltransferase
MVCGAALMVRRETMDQVGMLDITFDPIYAEEADWCYRVRQAGWKIYTHPRARIVHYGGQTMNRMPARKLELLQAHKAMFFRKHYGTTETAFFKASLWLSSLLKTAIYSIQGNHSVQDSKARLHRHMMKYIPHL